MAQTGGHGVLVIFTIFITLNYGLAWGFVGKHDYLLRFFVRYSLYFINTNWKMLDFVIFAAIIGLLILLFFALKESGK